METRSERYLEKSDLDSIGDALAHSRATIPLSLGHAPRRIDNHYKGVTGICLPIDMGEAIASVAPSLHPRGA